MVRNKLILSLSVVAASAAYVWYVAMARDGDLQGLVDRVSLGLGGRAPPPPLDLDNLPGVSPPGRPVPSAALSTPAQYRDGAYAGLVADAYHGIMQVQITVTGGKVSAVEPLHYPWDRDVSRRISYYVLPILETEVVQDHKSDVDMITGATLTVTAYRLSLSDALRQAGQHG